MVRSNDVAAEALQEFADLVAISGGDPYRARAYEKAAQSVAGHPRDLEGLDRNELIAIPAVGAHIAGKLLELRETGRIAELEELHAQVPAGLRSLLGVPGLGPKRAHQVYAELGISSIPELLNALHTQTLRDLKGWGAKSEENLAAAIRRMQESGGRIPLAVALDLAEELVADLEPLATVEYVAYAGSLRRMKETIGDIDLLVAADDAAPVMDAFCSLPLVDRVLAHGTTKSAVVTTKGIQVDLRVVTPAVWGAALLYFTGSKAHNVRVRRLALERGLTLSEYGLFRAEDGSLVTAVTEEDVYAALGLPWILPTLREDRGEVEAALAGALPDVVEVGDLRGDLHLHTDLTDGLATAAEMVAAAKAHGYRYCAITDHAPLMAMQRMTTEKATDQRALLRQLAADHDITVLHGSELNIGPDGSLDWDDDFLASFDVLVASVHSHFDQPSEVMTRRLITAIEHPYVNIIGHPTGRSLGRRPPVDFDADAVFAAAARTGTAMEINSFPDRLDLNEDLARRARDHGVVFAIDTDSHSVLHLDNIRFGVATAQRGWVAPGEVINTWPLRRLRSFLAKGRRPGRARTPVTPARAG